MSSIDTQKHPLIHRAQGARLKNLQNFSDEARALTESIDVLAEEYAVEKIAAKDIGERKGRYISDNRDGTGGTADSNRFEEHLAMALYRYSQQHGPAECSSAKLQIFDYQVPLKTKRSERGVGKIDLLGSWNSRLAVVELKVAHFKETRNMDVASEAPLRAIIESLAYCAIVEEHRARILDELGSPDVITSPKPVIVVLAPRSYWAFYENHSKSGPWRESLILLTDAIAKHSDIAIDTHLVAVENTQGIGRHWASDKEIKLDGMTLALA